MSRKMAPRTIWVDACTYCQLTCPECPTRKVIDDTVIGRGYLEAANFAYLLERNPWIAEVELSNYGEIFLNPELLDIIEIGSRAKVDLTAYGGANLNNVSEEVLEGLVKYRFRLLTCSIDGASPETYRIYRVGGDFNTVIENVKKINFFKKKYRSRYPILKWQFLVFGHNEHELPVAREMASGLDMDFAPALSVDSDFSPVRDEDYVRSVLGFASNKEYKEIFGIHYYRDHCLQLWHKPKINWDGRVLGCCQNCFAEFGGNAFEDDLVKCLNGEKIAYARRMLTGVAPHKDDIPCASCWLYQDIRAEGNWLKLSIPHGAALWVYGRVRPPFGVTRSAYKLVRGTQIIKKLSVSRKKVHRLL